MWLALRSVNQVLSKDKNAIVSCRCRWGRFRIHNCRACSLWGFIPSPTVFRRPHSALQEGSLGDRHAHLRSKLMSESVYVTQECSIGADRLWPSFQLSLQLWILMLLPCGNFPCPFLQWWEITSFSPISCPFLWRKSFLCYTYTSIIVKCLNFLPETSIKCFKIRKELKYFCRKA